MPDDAGMPGGGMPGMPGGGMPGMPGGGGMPGMPGGGGMPGMPGGGGMPGMPGGGGMPGMPGGGGMPGMPGQSDTAATMTKVRVLAITDLGQVDSGAIDIDTSQEAVEGWYQVAIPVSKFAGPGRQPGAKLQKLAFFGDAKEYFWIGRVQLVAEDQPLKADAGGKRTAKVGEEVTFTAAGQARDVAARYSWDFDDWDGIGEDALGTTASWKFEEAGYYVVTLTVSDPGKTKVPQIAHVHVHVTE
jgi:hypothetical protein